MTLLDQIAATLFSDYSIATMTLNAIDAFDTIVAFEIPLVAILTTKPVMWREEHLWNFSVLQRVLLSIVVIIIRWPILQKRPVSARPTYFTSRLTYILHSSTDSLV
jgi:uncharacterized membrane protein